MYKHTFYYFLGNKKYPEIYILPIKEEKKDQGANVLFRHVCLCVEHEEDENAEGGGDKVERKVPENGCRPVGRRMDSTHKVKMFHLKRI